MRNFFISLAIKTLGEEYSSIAFIIGLIISIFLIATSLGAIYYLITNNLTKQIGYGYQFVYCFIYFWITNSILFLYYGGDSNKSVTLETGIFNILRIVIMSFSIHIIISMIRKIINRQ